MFDRAEFDDHQQVVFFTDVRAGLRAVIAIHRIGPMGAAGGGCRIWPYADADAAVRDALRLSRAMTYKLALAELPAGGAKMVVIADSGRDKSEALLRAIGRAVHALGGRYIVAEDVGTTAADLEVIAQETPYVGGRASGGDVARATAYGVYVGMREAVRHGLGREQLRGLRIAVQGVGNVGRALCKYLADDGAQLFVSDLKPDAVRQMEQQHDARAVGPDEILGVDVDVLAPCALGPVLDDETVPRLRCRVIAGSANNQLAAPRHAEQLAQRGILYAPDFVVSAGGIIGAALGMVGGRREEWPEVQRVADNLRRVFALAERQGLSTHAAAEQLAQQRMAATGLAPGRSR